LKYFDFKYEFDANSFLLCSQLTLFVLLLFAAPRHSPTLTTCEFVSSLLSAVCSKMPLAALMRILIIQSNIFSTSLLNVWNAKPSEKQLLLCKS